MEHRPYLLPATLLVGVMGGAASTLAQPPPKTDTSPPPTFAGTVELVTVDAVVTQKDGRPVAGLQREDFTLLEEGVKQEISSFEAVDLPAPAPGRPVTPRPPVSTNRVADSRTSRSFVIVFDDHHLSPLNAQRAKAAVAAFLDKGVREGDRVTLIATGGAAWWSTQMEAGRADLLALLKGLDGRRIPDSGYDHITDYEAMRVYVYQDTLAGNRVLRRFESLGLNLPDLRDRTRQEREEREAVTLPGVNDLLVESRAADAYQRARARNEVTFTALDRALKALTAAKGRKALILVSEGFINDPSMDAFKDVTEAARRANVAIYFVDTRGLQALPGVFSAQFGPAIDERDMSAALADTSQEAAGSELLALDTGGFAVRNTNDMLAGVDRIARESRTYYLLGYNPRSAPRDGRFRRIQVQVARKGVGVRARKGYYAPLDPPVAAATPPKPRPKATAPPRTEKDEELQRALDSPYPADAIPLRMAAYVRDETLLGKARVLVDTDIDVADLPFDESADGGGRLRDVLDVLLVVAHRDSGESYRDDQKIELALLPGTRDRLRQSWYSHVREFELPPGGYQAKVVVRDRNRRRLGTVTHEFEVVSLEQLRISSPILTDAVQQAEGRGLAPVLVARRTFPRGGALYCQFDVYGAARDKTTGKPRVSAGYEVRRADGTVARRGEPTPIEPTSLGYLSRMLAMGLAGMPAGDYELVLRVRDEVAGKVQEAREPFTLVTGSSPSAP